MGNELIFQMCKEYWEFVDSQSDIRSEHTQELWKGIVKILLGEDE